MSRKGINMCVCLGWRGRRKVRGCLSLVRGRFPPANHPFSTPQMKTPAFHCQHFPKKTTPSSSVAVATSLLIGRVTSLLVEPSSADPGSPGRPIEPRQCFPFLGGHNPPKSNSERKVTRDSPRRQSASPSRVVGRYPSRYQKSVRR